MCSACVETWNLPACMHSKHPKHKIFQHLTTWGNFSMCASRNTDIPQHACNGNNPQNHWKIQHVYNESTGLKYSEHGMCRVKSAGHQYSTSIFKDVAYAPFKHKFFSSVKMLGAIAFGMQLHMYHSPQKHYLPEKNIFELFSNYRFTISISSN